MIAVQGWADDGQLELLLEHQGGDPVLGAGNE